MSGLLTRRIPSPISKVVRNFHSSTVCFGLDFEGLTPTPKRGMSFFNIYNTFFGRDLDAVTEDRLDELYEAGLFELPITKSTFLGQFYDASSWFDEPERHESSRLFMPPSDQNEQYGISAEDKYHVVTALQDKDPVRSFHRLLKDGVFRSAPGARLDPFELVDFTLAKCLSTSVPQEHALEILKMSADSQLNLTKMALYYFTMNQFEVPSFFGRALIVKTSSARIEDILSRVGTVSNETLAAEYFAAFFEAHESNPAYREVCLLLQRHGAVTGIPAMLCESDMPLLRAKMLLDKAENQRESIESLLHLH